MGKKNRRSFRKMQEQIKQSKLIAEQQRQQMRYNSRPLQITCSTPPSNITWGTKR